AASAGSRGARMVGLLSAATVLQLLDLALTLTFMKTTGMVELNPLARWIVDMGGAEGLVAFKAASVLVSLGVLFAVRHHRSAEIGAWIMCAVLLALTARWIENVAALAMELHAIAPMEAMGDERWVRIAD
ncbi:MAG: DUF5658 family protein, partial [Planctomycetota bacterium]|nr:DUF5658 family protein [Planctomycetota bacterium]